MTDAEKVTASRIERTLMGSPAYRKIEDRLYVVKQGSTFVMITIVPQDDGRALVRCVGQLVRGVQMDLELAQKLLELNAVLRFGGFAYVADGNVVVFVHTILGGNTLDAEELLATVRDVALIADEYDDQITATHGGQTMEELLEEGVVEHVRRSIPRPPNGETLS